MSIFKRIFVAFRGRERVAFFAALFTAIASGVSITAWVYYRATVPAPARGGEYTEGIVGQPHAINPVLAANDTDRLLVRLAFRNLADLADKIEAANGGQVWKIRLKERLAWSDGKKLTSDDIIFTVERIQNPESQSPLFVNWRGVKASRSSELELQFSLASTYALFPDTLRTLYVIPKHLFADVPTANWRLSEYLLRPVGSGPYRFASYERDASGLITAYRFVTNPYYSDTPSFIPRVNVRFYTDTRDLARAFNTGQIDGFATIEPSTLGEMRRPYRVIPFRLPSYYAVFLNQTLFAPFREKAVREALDIAVDRRLLAERVFGPYALPVEGPIPPTLMTQDPPRDVAPPQSDRAVTLLTAAGWEEGESGVRVKRAKGGDIRLSFELAVPRVPFLVAAADGLKEMWRRVGVEARVIPFEVDDASVNTIRNREYQALLFGNVLGPSGDLFSFWHSSERFSPGLNLSLYGNRTVDTLLGDIRRTLDPAARTDLFRAIDRTIRDDHPAVFLFSPDSLFISSKSIKGVEGGAISDPADRMLGIPRWYVKTARVLQ